MKTDQVAVERLSRKLHVKLAITGAILVNVFMLQSCTSAAPVTLQFDGTIGPARDGTFPIALPFAFDEGEHITGSFTFEPIDAPSNTPQTNTLQNTSWKLRIDATYLESSMYEIRVTNDSMSDENPNFEDRIVLRCLGSGVGCSPMPIENFDHIEWSFSSTLTGGSGVLEGADIPGDPSVWNQFSTTILVSFRDRTTGRGTGFRAVIETYRVVPEPASAIILMSGVAAIAINSTRHRFNHHR